MRRIVIIAMALAVLSCGHKTPPRWVEYPAPAVPSDLAAVKRPEGVALTWTASDGALYTVERSEGGAPFKAIADAGGKRTYADLAAFNFEQRYRIRARDARGGGSGEPSGQITAPAADLMAAPDAPKITIGPDSLTVNCPGGGACLIYHTAGELEPLASTPVELDREVSFVTRALISNAGGVRVEGPASQPSTVLPQDYVPSAPAHPDYALTNGKVMVFWDAAPESWARGYRVYRAEGCGGFSAIGESRTPAYTDNVELAPGASFTYRVTTLGPVAEGPASAVVIVNAPANTPAN